MNSLNGRVAGAMITSTSGNPGASTSIMLRGISSISSNNQPLFVVDGLSIPDAGKAYIRVINLVSNGPGVDLVIGTAAPFISNVAYKSASDFVAVTPANSSAPLTLQVRSAGTTALFTIASTNFTAAAGRKYTILVRGLVGKTGAQAPTVSSYTTK